MADKDKSKEDQKGRDEQTPPHNFEKIGPLSIEGVEASDLPDGGRGNVDHDPRKAQDRRPPNKTGETETGDVGLRATPDLSDADQHGGRGRN